MLTRTDYAAYAGKYCNRATERLHLVLVVTAYSTKM